MAIPHANPGDVIDVIDVQRNPIREGEPGDFPHVFVGQLQTS